MELCLPLLSLQGQDVSGTKMAGEFLEPAVEKKVNITRRDRSEILKERFERLPAADQRILNITQARFASSLPMAVLPFITTTAVYESSVNQPLMEGDLNCATCALIRGGLIGASVGSLYPVLLALPLNAGLATRYNTSPMPNKENMLQYWKSICKPVFNKIKFAVILQIAFGTYLSSKHHEIYLKMLRMPEPGRDTEELKE
ncbi:hypothetical protein JD844_033518 [Phrynosoma platyrhinos]|uniref:Transmembrane protein 126A n=1 Tax=Phrynosoma platyrhinos TaxID=52577 RepID=A0ABQ7T655_PHRPL|nr:hypothetical protein JD844_033518 [Phrynosoma platyrhinos]